MFPKMLIASGMTYPEIIDRLVELALDRHAHRRRNTKH
jgi:D-alanine-D-alanine ligase